MRAAGERDPDTAILDAEADGLESDGSPMASDTLELRLNWKSGGRLFRKRRSLARQTARSYPKAGSALRG